MGKVRHPQRLGLHVRIVLPGGTVLGPGRADLLDAILRTGSIAAASREMGMSYKRAWDLVVDMNAGFREPLVQAAHGGVARGGARLTEAGEMVLAAYRRTVAAAERASASDVERLRSLLADAGDGREQAGQRNGR